jgi:hypothetical protein
MVSIHVQQSSALISLFEAISSIREDLALDDFDAITIAWVIQSGLGPFLYRAVRRNARSLANSQWTWLKTADLTARIVIGNIFKLSEKSPLPASQAFRR